MQLLRIVFIQLVFFENGKVYSIWTSTAKMQLLKENHFVEQHLEET